MGDTLRAGRGCWGGAGLLLLICSSGLGRAGRKHLRSRGAVLPGWAVREEPSVECRPEEMVALCEEEEEGEEGSEAELPA